MLHHKRHKLSSSSHAFEKKRLLHHGSVEQWISKLLHHSSVEHLKDASQCNRNVGCGFSSVLHSPTVLSSYIPNIHIHIHILKVLISYFPPSELQLPWGHCGFTDSRQTWSRTIGHCPFLGGGQLGRPQTESRAQLSTGKCPEPNFLGRIPTVRAQFAENQIFSPTSTLDLS